MTNLSQLRKNHTIAVQTMATFVTFASGRRETLPGFEAAQDRCLELKAQIRAAILKKG